MKRARAIPQLLGWATTGAVAVGCTTILGFEDLSGMAEDASTPQQDATAESAPPETGTDSALVGDVAVDASAEDAPSQDVESESCGDTQSDLHNCGGCGHDCLTGKCESGKCQSVSLITQLQNPGGMAVYDGQVYVAEKTDPGRVLVVPRTGGPEKELAKGSDLYFPCALAATKDRLFIANCVSPGGEIRSCPLPEGCGAVASSLVASNTGIVGAMIVRGETLYWTEEMKGAIRSIQIEGIDGGTPASGTVMPTTAGYSPDKLVERNGMMYFSDTSTYSAGVYGISIGGGEVAEIETGRAWGLAIGADSLVWTRESLDDGKVVRWTMGADAEAPALIASNQPDPWDVAADDNAAYWVVTGANKDLAQGKVVSVSLKGGEPPHIVAPDQEVPRRIMVDDKAIYWLNLGLSTGGELGALKMIAK